jgi:hypothetical protein
MRLWTQVMEKKGNSKRGRVLKVQKQTGTVFEKMNRSRTGKCTALLTTCSGKTRKTPSDQEIDRIIIAHDMVSAL